MLSNNADQKAIAEVSKKVGITSSDAEKALESYYRSIADAIREDKPIIIILPYLGKLIPNKTYVKEFSNEVNNT